ncbi:MAG: M28 family peptidase [Planctomycetota bacterium]|nr:M28 family peptidase [Planctomycetota bacterium]
MRTLALALLLVVAGCQRDISDERLLEMSLAAERESAFAASAAHDGPGVAETNTGTARFASIVFAGFSAERALETTAFADRFYREPANDGFEAVIDHVATELGAVGFGASDALTLEVLETPLKTPSWTPKSARLELVGAPSARVLHSFSKPEDRDRTMLPCNAPSADVEGRLVTTLDAVEAGCVLLADTGLRGKLLEDARAKGAVLVIASDLADYCIDPKKKGDRHRDAIGYRHVSYPAALPVVQISPRSADLLREALALNRETRIHFQCEVAFVERPLRTVVATIVGASKPFECVALAAHVQEPGACDNASGVGTLLEAARVAVKSIQAREIATPSRSISFVFGNEMAQSRIFLDHTTRRVIAGLAADMTGESLKETGAIALLERTPDPGALKALAPDRHTAWSKADGATATVDELSPNGLAVIARCALVDVGRLSKAWKTAEHPYEGGSDHTVFLARDVPAVLFWHFTDFAYHTSLDRLENVDANEMKRTGAALLSTALAVADASPVDLERYLASLQREAAVRVQSANEASDPEIEQAWREWTTGARLWLRALCLATEWPASKNTIPAPIRKSESP